MSATHVYQMELTACGIQELLRELRSREHDHRVLDVEALADRLEKQIPLPAPDKIGAIVRTVSDDVYIRVSLEDALTKQWWRLGEGITRDEQDAQWAETSEIGRIVQVLSEGVNI